MQYEAKRPYVLTLSLDFDHLMIVVILFFSTLNISLFSAYFQWKVYQFILYSRLARYALLASSAVYIGYVYLITGKKSLSPFTLAVYAYLVYMLAVTYMYNPGAVDAMLHEGFTWPVTMVAYCLYAGRTRFTWVYRVCLVISFLVVLVPVVGILGSRHAAKANIGIINYLISYLPMILFLCKGKIRVIIAAAAAVFTVLSQKRGVTLAVLIGFALMVPYYIFDNKKGQGKIGKVLLIAFGVLMLVWIAGMFDATRSLLDRFQKAFDDKGSGRDLIYSQLLDGFKRSPIINQIVGHGYHAFPRDYQPYGAYTYAHNSYLETLYDLGIAGLAGLVALIITVLVKMWKKIRVKDRIGYPAMLAFSITIVFSMVSFLFDECVTVLMVTAFWGVLMGEQTPEERQPEPVMKPECRYIR